VSAAPPTESGTKRRIGDILLQLGFASEAALARASAEQEQTGQPIGQILVEHGVITRLELASALAEQWSDIASIAPLPVPSARPRTPQPHDEDQYAARLQDAVAELAQRVDASRPDEGADSRVLELAERIEATVARTQRLEATLATLAESFDGVTSGVEEAFGVLQSGMAELALDLARLDATVAELRTQPADTSHLEQHLEELRLAVHGLAERPFVDEDARRRADALAVAVGGFADGAALEAIRGELVGLEKRIEELGAERAILGELRSAVAELQDRPTGDPELDVRLGRIETQLVDLSSGAPAAAEVETLAGRLEKTRDAQDDLGRSLEKVAARLTELTERLDLLAAHDRESELEGRLHELEAHLRDGYVTCDELAQALDQARDELRPEPVAPDPRIDRHNEDLEALRNEIGRIEQVEARLGPGVVTPDELAQALDRVAEDLRPALTALGPRVDRLAEELGALRDDVARASATPAEDSTARAELAAIADQVERLVTRDELARSVAESGKAPGKPPAGPDPRVDRLAHDLELLRSEVARIEPAPGLDPDVAGRLAALVTRVEGLGGVQQESEALGRELEALQGRIGSAVTQDDLREAVARAREELVSELETLRDGLGQRADDVDTAALADALERLSHRLEGVEERTEAATAVPQPNDTSALAADVAALADRMAPLEALGARVDQLAEALAARMPLDQAPVGELRDELDARLTELTRALEDRLAGASDTPASGVRGMDGGIENELERMRMAIERLSLHLGEHERALTEMRGSRSIAQRLEELSARLEDVAASGPHAAPEPSPPGEGSYARRSIEPDIEMRSVMRRLEDLEEAASAGREKLMNRLERMASSIDWRLQRLEAADQETS
jgi:hypothetical protein